MEAIKKKKKKKSGAKRNGNSLNVMQLLNTSVKVFCTTHQKYVVKDAEDEEKKKQKQKEAMGKIRNVILK